MNKPTLAARFNSVYGSWRVIGALASGFVVWVAWNALAPSNLQFDPSPFLILNLITGAAGLFTAPLLLMAQNRQDARIDALLTRNTIETDKILLEVESNES